MRAIVTLTVNPSIDGSAETDVIRPIHKLRTSNERYDPGGGGINVARVVHELGGSAMAIYLAGGATGAVLDRLLADAGINGRRVPIADHTRISHAVYERSSGLEYRFVPQGPMIQQSEWQASLAALEDLECEYFVASGSLPPGMPDTFYATVAAMAHRRKFKLVLDTSGRALQGALQHGVHMVKPSLGELEALRGQKLPTPARQEEAARDMVRSGAATMVALTLGRDGGLLVTEHKALRMAAPEVAVKSAVGAGDSFVAAMTLGLAQSRAPEDAFAYGMAAGAAAVMSAGTGLCRREDVEKLYARINRR